MWAWVACYSWGRGSRMKVCVSEPVFTTAFGDLSYWLGKKGGGNRSVRWGEDRLTTGLLQLKTFSSGKMSNNWDTATEEVERWKNKKRDPLEEMKAFLMRALRLFFFSSNIWPTRARVTASCKCCSPAGLRGWMLESELMLMMSAVKIPADTTPSTHNRSESASAALPCLFVRARVCVCMCARMCMCVCACVGDRVCAWEVKPVSQWEAKVRLRATKIWLISIFRASDVFPKEDGSMRWGWYNYVNVIFIEGRDFSF